MRRSLQVSRRSGHSNGSERQNRRRFLIYRKLEVLAQLVFHVFGRMRSIHSLLLLLLAPLLHAAPSDILAAHAMSGWCAIIGDKCKVDSKEDLTRCCQGLVCSPSDNKCHRPRDAQPPTAAAFLRMYDKYVPGHDRTLGELREQLEEWRGREERLFELSVSRALREKAKTEL